MVQVQDAEMARGGTWSGVERRSVEDRRLAEDRRSSGRTTWQRRSGHDRRGHKLYARSRAVATE